MATAAALPYHEPSIVTILILSSFLILSNVINYILDRLVFCGLIGQIAIGVAWGVPGANWLSTEVQDAIVQIGYLGLIVLVFEGEWHSYDLVPLLAWLITTKFQVDCRRT
jgi:NhaP-type Na+/H+ or K+/H+ antiporter